MVRNILLSYPEDWRTPPRPLLRNEARVYTRCTTDSRGKSREFPQDAERE